MYRVVFVRVVVAGGLVAVDAVSAVGQPVYHMYVCTNGRQRALEDFGKIPGPGGFWYWE